MAQYVEGSATKRLGKLKKQVVYSTLLSEKEILTVSSGSHIKVATRGLCKIVFYENSKVKVPKPNKTWRFAKGTNARLICPTGENLTVKYKSQTIEVQGGEALFLDGKLFTLKGDVLGNKLKLDAKKLYEFDNGKFEVDEDDEHELFALDNKYAKPKESLKWEPMEDEKTKPLWIAGFAVGGGATYHTNEHWSKDYFSTKDLDFDGFRVAVIFNKWNYNIIASFSENELSEPGFCNNYESSDCSRYDFSLAEIGLRNSNRFFNYFYQLGFGTVNYSISMQVDDPPSFNINHRDFEYFALSALLGVDKVIQINSWLSIYASAHIRYVMTISFSNGDKFGSSSGLPTEVQNTIQDGFDSFSGQLYLGAAVTF